MSIYLMPTTSVGIMEVQAKEIAVSWGGNIGHS